MKHKVQLPQSDFTLLWNGLREFFVQVEPKPTLAVGDKVFLSCYDPATGKPCLQAAEQLRTPYMYGKVTKVEQVTTKVVAYAVKLDARVLTLSLDSSAKSLGY